MPQSGNPRQLPVWPYPFLAITTGIAGLMFVAFWWPQDYPDRSELTAISGEIDRVRIRDDISKTSAGAILPAITSVYFTLKEIPGEFRYPSSHPKYPMVRDRTANAVDILVQKQGEDESVPALIWQLFERNPHDKEEDLTRIHYDDVVERLTAANRSVVTLGFWLLTASAGFLIVWLGVMRWNRARLGCPQAEGQDLT